MFDGLSRHLANLSRHFLNPTHALQRAVVEAAEPAPTGFAAASAGQTVAVEGFGSNPGQLRMLVYGPARPPRPGAPLLVLLHGCGQDAAGFAAAAGFMALAERLRLGLLLPEQQSGNNPGRCFNWFNPPDIARGGGEAESVHQMVAEAVRRFDADPARVYVAGLSAGAALAVALLAAYPESFAGGGAVAGLPVGAAHDLGSAFNRMARAGDTPRAALVARIAAPHVAVRWPRLSIWSGEADRTVDPANSRALAAQWTGLLGLPEFPDRESQPAAGVRCVAWGDAVEHWSLAGFGHAVPVAVDSGQDPFVQRAAVQAADVMARFWGLDPE
jgi:poly(hydroxyalkanoate) depolymerase family esterase